MTDTINQWSDSEIAELKKVFYSQAYEIVDEIQDAMLRLEADPDDEETLKTVKRHVHTLKGDANSIELVAIGTLCHRMEDILSSLMDCSGGRLHEAVDLLLSCIDTVYNLLVRSESGKDGGDAQDTINKIDLFLNGLNGSNRLDGSNGSNGHALTEYDELQIQDALKAGLHLYDIEVCFHPQCGEKSVAGLMVMQRLGGKGRIIRSSPDPESGDLNGSRTMTILFGSELDAEAVKREALITGITTEIIIREFESADHIKCGPRSAERGTMEDVASKSSDSCAPLPASHSAVRTEMLRVEASRLDRIMDLVGELIISRSMVDQVTREMETGALQDDAVVRLNAVNASMERTVSDLQKGVMKMRMVPIHHVFRKFPKMVRDLSAEKGKRVRLDVFGNETELDKGIVDVLGEPLAHIVRNFIDHGIEAPDQRRSAGKPEEGRITLRAYHEASQIVIEADDDGKGIDTEALKRKAVEKGFVSQKEMEKMSAEDAVNLIFLPGLSTTETVTETSGRGVGMDAVKTAVDGMKGSVEIETTRGKGTLFRLRLPLTLALIKALLFEVGERLYAIPVPVIAEVSKIMTDELVTVEGRKTLLLRDQVISVISLEELFRVTGNNKKKKYILILGVGGKRVGLLIDKLMWQQQLVIKAIDGRHAPSAFVAGASILGNGKVVLILDVLAVFKKAVEEEKKKRRVAA